MHSKHLCSSITCGFLLGLLFCYSDDILRADNMGMEVRITPLTHGSGTRTEAPPLDTQPSQPLIGPPYEPLPQPTDLMFETLNVRQLHTINTVSRTLAVDPTTARKQLPRIEPTIRQEIQIQTGFALAGSIEKTFIETMAVVSVKNPELSTSRGMRGYLQDAVRVYGKQPFQEAQINIIKAEILTKVVASAAIGRPFDRRKFDKEYRQLGILLLKREKEVIKSGDFQTFFRRKPSIGADWNLIKIVAYRGRVINRSLPREIAARQRYEKVFNVKLAILAQSQKEEDKEVVAKSWSFIRAAAASGLTIPK